MTGWNVAKNKPASSCAGQLKKSSVLLQAQFVTTIHGFKIGMLLDLGSTDNYVTHKFTKRYNLQSKDINLEIEGIGGKKSYVSSKIYTFPILIRGQVRNP